ncbi:uncharacterized protein LOC128959872 [Oppia nitens]|uniref:uncharacterized protein LOC128959872 n=1 Tax=Oppia nitens TaxID=1686743 RepID=UPI0023DC17F9|nr:uncharacterized protein LOC128959872 [Oppia nitens]
MFQSKEHLIRSSDPSLWGFAGLDLNNDEDLSHKIVTRIWKSINSKIFNVVIVVLVLIDTFVIISQILIDSHWIQDPKWRPIVDFINTTNTTTNYSKNSMNDLSPSLATTRHILQYISLTMISFFFIEVLFRIYSGKCKLFVQLFDLLDAILVVIVFSLSFIFYFYNFRDQSCGKQSLLLLIILRLWRFFQIVKLVIEDSQQRIVYTLNVCEKERTHCEHKIDILILKVEDLEHEVAYLKEKLKKTEKENSCYVQQLIDSKPKPKMNAKRTQSSQSYCPCRKDSFKGTVKHPVTAKLLRNYSQPNGSNNYIYVDIDVDVESQPLVSKTSDENHEMSPDLDVFAKNLAESITIDVMNAVIDKTSSHLLNSLNELLSESPNDSMQSQSNKPLMNPSSSYLFSNQLFNNSLIKSAICNGTGLHYNHITNQSNHWIPKQSNNTTTLDSSCVAQELNNEDKNVERIHKAVVDINDQDIPMNSL